VVRRQTAHIDRDRRRIRGEGPAPAIGAECASSSTKIDGTASALSPTSTACCRD